MLHVTTTTTILTSCCLVAVHLQHLSLIDLVETRPRPSYRHNLHLFHFISLPIDRFLPLFESAVLPMASHGRLGAQQKEKQSQVDYDDGDDDCCCYCQASRRLPGVADDDADDDDRYDPAMQSGKKVRALDFIIILIRHHAMCVLQRFIAGRNDPSPLVKSTASPFDV